MFQTKVVDKIKTYILCSKTFFRKRCCLYDNIKTCGSARQFTGDTTRRMSVARCIIKATDTHSEYVYLFIFHGNNGYKNALQCYTYIVCLVTIMFTRTVRLCSHEDRSGVQLQYAAQRFAGSSNTKALYINTSDVRGSNASVSFAAGIRVVTSKFRPAPAMKTY